MLLGFTVLFLFGRDVSTLANLTHVLLTIALFVLWVFFFSVCLSFLFMLLVASLALFHCRMPVAVPSVRATSNSARSSATVFHVTYGPTAERRTEGRVS